MKKLFLGICEIEGVELNQIESNGVILAQIVRKEETLKPGLNFFSQSDEKIQIAIWNHEKNKVLDAHIHNPIPRQTIGTQEIIFVVSGRLHFDIYDDAGMLIFEGDLYQGDILICIQGGHGYKILDSGTQILEIKNGPYFGVELDKSLIQNRCKS